VLFRPLTAAVCLCFLTSAARAEFSEAAQRWFDSFDQDKDGVLTPEEYKAVAEKQFRRVDANGDGAVDEAEYVYGVPEGNDDELARAKKRFSIMDKNGDGSATEEEFVGFGQQVIDLSDFDGDGKMTRDEFAASVSAPSE
jgi:Ca2+-binding EF-hand superfamily protein